MSGLAEHHSVQPRLEEADLVKRAVGGEAAACREIIRSHNQRLFRLARSILRDDGEAEDALQEAYVRAFSRLGEFRGASALATWLSRIVINEALGRLRRSQPRLTGAIELSTMADIVPFPGAIAAPDPERATAQREILRFVERAVDELPDIFRTVFVARVIEGLSVDETAESLSLRPETVKTRLFRARELLRDRMDREIGSIALDAFPFAGARCERLTNAVLRRLGFEAGGGNLPAPAASNV